MSTQPSDITGSTPPSGSRVFGRSSRYQPPVAAGGEGCWLIDTNGKRYLDGSGGAAVSCLGHGDPEVIAAIQEQVGSLAYAHTGFFTSAPAEALADSLVAQAPAGIEHVYFLSGGSEAIEASLKLARQYCIERGEPGRHRVIARQHSYHGNTLGALATGGHVGRRAPFQSMLFDVSHIAPCHPYRYRHDDESEFAYGQRVANELEAEIERVGAESVVAFVAETVVGATLGAVAAVDGYFARIREICDTHGVLLILDEVMCGMGRTGSLFASEQEDVRPDIVCIAKGLGGGYQPIGAMMASREIYATIARGSGAFSHGHTYVGHPVACAASLAVLNAIVERDLIARVRTQGAALKERLEHRFGNHPAVGDIRGRGLFMGLEFVADRQSKTPLDPAHNVAAQLKRHAFEAGLVCYPDRGTADGVRGDHVLLAPPYIIDDDELDQLVDRLAHALELTLADAG